MTDELLQDLFEAGQAHVDDQGLIRAREFRPVEVDAIVLPMAGDEPHRLRDVAVGERNAGIAGSADAGGDARHHPAVDAFAGEGLDLLAAAAEDERVTAFQAHHLAPGLGMGHQQVVDAFLADAVELAPLADVDLVRVPAGVVEHGAVHQVVVEHHVRLLQQS